MKIIVLQGIPASGKSTWAREFVEEHDDYVIVNRDSFRNGAGKYWVPKREEYITSLETSAVISAIDHGYNVIIDATNFNKDTLSKWENISKMYHTELEIKRFDISFNEAVKRDAARENPVGVKVIRRFYNQYCNFRDERIMKTPENDKPFAVICDIDGTLALRTNRNPFDYKKYSTDIPEFRVVKLIEYLSKQFPIIFLSGREGNDEAYANTLQWLRNNITLDTKVNPEYTLLMRQANDRRHDEVVKKEIYQNQIEPKYNVLSVFDDRNKVVNMWRELGLLCCQVYDGDF